MKKMLALILFCCQAKWARFIFVWLVNSAGLQITYVIVAPLLLFHVASSRLDGAHGQGTDIGLNQAAQCIPVGSCQQRQMAHTQF